MAKRVYHWKHGWIPLDHTAAKEKGASAVEYRQGLPDGRQNFVTAHLNGERIGEMSWHEKDKHITWTSVYDEKNRRKGVASGMLAKALEHDPQVRHNHGGGDGLTADGKRFADATPITSPAMPFTATSAAQPVSSEILGRFTDARLLAEIKRRRSEGGQPSPTLRILLREAYHRGLDTRSK